MESAHLDIEGLVHDLNNVFQTLAESAELLSTDPKWTKLAATLHRSVDRGQRIANSIFQRKRSISDIAAVVENAIAFVRDYLGLIHGPDITFQCKIEPQFNAVGHPASWERVLVNLFMNAVEAGGRNVTVYAADNEITISDDGPGIAPGLLPTIFQPHVSTKSITSGLGLYVVRSIVEENGGEVSATNSAAGGAVFRIRLDANDIG